MDGYHTCLYQPHGGYRSPCICTRAFEHALSTGVRRKLYQCCDMEHWLDLTSNTYGWMHMKMYLYEDIFPVEQEHQKAKLYRNRPPVTGDAINRYDSQEQ
jgi:hypothetical protein